MALRMKVLKWLLGGLVALVALVAGGFWASAKINAHLQKLALEAHVKPVCEAGPKGPARADVARLAADPATRLATYYCLESQRKLALMPAEQRTQQALAESCS
jgi:hypothetical protein